MPSSRLRESARVLVVLVGFAAAGALAGWGWHAWWAPAPEAVVFRHRPFFMPDGEFRSTGTYVAIAAPLGFVLGAVVTVWRRRAPLVGVLAVLAGAVLAGGVMLLVGSLLSPGDPVATARHAQDLATVRGSLRVQPGAAWCVLPASAMVGALVVLLLTPPDPATPPGE